MYSFEKSFIKDLNIINLNKNLLQYITFRSKIYELFNMNLSSGQDIYFYLNSIPNFISKLNIGSIWDSKAYWLLIFF